MLDPYYSDDRSTLWAGDALDVLPSIPDGSVTAAIIDPPYSMVPNAVRGRDDGAAGTSGAPVMLVNETLRHCRRVLRDGGIAAIICDWRRVPDISYLVTLTGMRLATCVAWTRTTIGTGGLFRSAWDPVLIAANGTPDAIDRAAIPNVVCVNPPTVRQHPYEKPPALWEHILQRVSPGVVLDPYAGSGASAVAALNTGHTWVGIELDPNYCNLIAAKLTAPRAEQPSLL